MQREPIYLFNINNVGSSDELITNKKSKSNIEIMNIRIGERSGLLQFHKLIYYG